MNHRLFTRAVWVIFFIQLAGRPVSTSEHDSRDWGKELDDKMYELEYEKYLSEVFKILQSDEYFFGKMMEEYRKEGQTGIKMVDHLHKLPNILRRRLDDLKFDELGRLQDYGKKLKGYGFSDERIEAHVKHASMHLDMSNKRTFTPKDLRLLIRETTEHFRVMDEIRTEHFKEYEMHKRLELEELRKRLTPEEQAEIDLKLEELKQSKEKTRPMHMPLSRPHVLEIWEGSSEGNTRENFNLKTFFLKHDLNGDKVWDDKEVDLLLQKEISRFYDPEDEDYDEKERNEEMKRMKHYVYDEVSKWDEKKVDTDKDTYINFQELYKHVKWMDKSEIEFWSSLADQPQFTAREYEEYSARHRAEVNKLIDEGKMSLPKSGIVNYSKIGKGKAKKPLKMKPHVEKEL